MDSLYNINEIRNQARQSITEGAVTENYPLDVHEACRLLNEALASEILCVLRYRHHQIIAKGINFLEVAAEFKEHADNEQRHMMMIAERIDQLGGNPNFNPEGLSERATTEYGAASRDLISLIKDDLIAERVVIDVYRRVIEWFGTKDPTSRRMLESILADEEEHANDLADLLTSTTRNN
jgi:bacterioferritin